MCAPSCATSIAFRAYALPSQWPTNVWQLEAAQRLLDERLRDHAARPLPPVSAVSASKLLLQIDVPANLPTPVNNAARALAWRLLELLGVKGEEDEHIDIAAPRYAEPTAASAVPAV